MFCVHRSLTESLDKRSEKQITGFENSANVKTLWLLSFKLETYFNILTYKLLFTLHISMFFIG